MIEWPSVHASAPHPPLHLPPPPLTYSNIHPAGYAAAAAHAYEPDVQLGAGLAADRGTPPSLSFSPQLDGSPRSVYGDGDGDGDGDGGHC